MSLPEGILEYARAVIRELKNMPAKEERNRAREEIKQLQARTFRDRLRREKP